MTLKDWIVKTGPKEVARLCQVDPSTVSNWKRGHSLPSAPQLVRINRLTNGRVNYAKVIEGFVRQSRGPK